MCMGRQCCPDLSIELSVTTFSGYIYQFIIKCNFRPPTKLLEGNVFTGMCHSILYGYAIRAVLIGLNDWWTLLYLLLIMLKLI